LLNLAVTAIEVSRIIFCFFECILPHLKRGADPDVGDMAEIKRLGS
jgi:hypothetical protein